MAYLNVDEIESALEALAVTYPDVTERIALPNTTAEGRSSHALRIGPADGLEAPGIIIVGGLHAREWVPPDALVYLAADLLEAHAGGTGLRYGALAFSADEIREIVTSLQLVLFPCVNPDGRQHSQTAHAMWRKNRRKVREGLPARCVGVDLNRNFDVLWDFRRHFAPDSHVSASDNPCDFQVYVGPAAASEPETRNVVWLLDHYPATRWFVDVHSYVPAVYHGWGVDENQTFDPSMSFMNPAHDGERGRAGDVYQEYMPGADVEAHQSLGRAMQDAFAAVNGTAYELGQSFSLYPTSGTSDDYAYSRHLADGTRGRILGFTIECGQSFQPSWEQAQHVIREVCGALTAFCRTAHGRTGGPGPAA